MPDIKLVKQWGSYKPGYVIKDASEVTVKELVGRLRVGKVDRTRLDSQVEKILEQEIAEIEKIDLKTPADEKLKEEFDLKTPGEEIKSEKKEPPQRRQRRSVKKRRS